jgi:cell division protein FtsI/penicillin-binding protein 2
MARRSSGKIILPPCSISEKKAETIMHISGPAKKNSYKMIGRLALLCMVGCSIFLVVLIRLASIQIFSSIRYTSLLKDQSERRLILPAIRGDILDRNGERLAYHVSNPIRISEQDRFDEFGSLNPSINHQGKIRYTTIKRVCPHGHLAGQVIGFAGRDGYGLAGIEYTFDDLLRGQPGWAVVGQDGKQRKYPIQGTQKVMPENGYHVKLTIDTRLQAIVEKALERGVIGTQSKQGMALVMDPRTGEILAMASYPFFNPNLLSQYTSGSWKNLNISYIYEPGSTFKIVTGSAALEEGIKHEKDIIDGDQGVFTIYNEEIRDSKPHGKLTFREAIAYSSNVCFAKIATEMGNNLLYKYARSFGFGSETGIQLPGEEKGILHPTNLWSGRTLVTMAIGHEMSCTLLQSACAFGAVANSGLLIKPTIVKEILDNQNTVVRSIEPSIVRRVMSKEKAEEFRSFLEDVVNYGTGSTVKIAGVRVAGKTGTAEKVDFEKKTYLKNKYLASFIGFLPADDPQLLCAVTLDEPSMAHTGGGAAGPVFKEIVTIVLHAPQLHYAENIVETSPDFSRGPYFFKSPSFVGMDRSKIKTICEIEGIRVAFMGKGNTVRTQMPVPGLLFPSEHEIVCFTDSVEYETVLVPSVKGKSVREALQQLNFLGIAVTVRGSGSVIEQSPLPGTPVQAGATCTITGNL